MIINTDFGLGEIVIRESHQNGKMVQERMMEVIAIVTEEVEGEVKNAYVCEDTHNGHRQTYSRDMLVGDPNYNQETGAYPKDPDEHETNKESSE